MTLVGHTSRYSNAITWQAAWTCSASLLVRKAPGCILKAGFAKTSFCKGRICQTRTPTQHSGDKVSLQVRLGLFRRSGCLCPNFFSTDNLAKSGFPGEIHSHGSFSPCHSQKLSGLKGASLKAHLLVPHQASALHLNPGFSKHLF